MKRKVDEAKEVKTTIISAVIEEKVVPSTDDEAKVNYAFVKNAFFEQEFNDPEEILDKADDKGSRETRVYVCVKIQFEDNTYLVPLRKKLANNIVSNPLLNKTYYKVPSDSKPNAGLDFRKTIIINDSSLYVIDEAKISYAQKKIIEENFAEISTLAIEYIKGFKKAAKKGRQKRDSLYRFSALNNFLKELKI